jgi:hypothetical protein
MMNREAGGTHLIYFDHKLADIVSVVTPIYSGYVLDKHNLIEIAVYRKLDIRFNEIPQEEILKKFHIIPVINNCDQKINFDFLNTACPYIPYKSYFKKYIKLVKVNNIKKYRSHEDKPKHIKIPKLSLG